MKPAEPDMSEASVEVLTRQMNALWDKAEAHDRHAKQLEEEASYERRMSECLARDADVVRQRIEILEAEQASEAKADFVAEVQDILGRKP